MRRALTKVLPEDRQWFVKPSCKSRNNNERPQYQNVCVSFWSAAFVFDSVLAIERAVYCRSGWGVFSFVGGLSLSLHSYGMEERRFGAKPQLNYVAADVGGTKAVKMGMLPR
jgi:hypothetical protein